MGFTHHLLACLTLQPEKTDPDRVRTAAVAPLPGDKDPAAAAAALFAKQRGADQPGEAGSIKAAPGSSLFAALGGADAVTAIVEAGLGKAQADWRVKRFLEGIDVKQTEAWLAATFGGPSTYSGPDLHELYSSLAAGRGLTASHLDAMAQHLADAMAELGMPEDMRAAAAAAVEDQRRLWCSAAPAPAQ